MTHAALIYPHQLFEDHPALAGVSRAVLVEEPLLMTQYGFHRQKLMLHRASLRKFAAGLKRRRMEVHYVEARDMDDTAEIAVRLKSLGVRSVQYVDPCDDWLATRLADGLERAGIPATVLPDPYFLTPLDEIRDFSAGKRRLFFTEFYIRQRKRLGILLEQGDKPVGGQWSFDPQNRRRLPQKIAVPLPPVASESDEGKEARRYVSRQFPGALGADEPLRYPTDHAAAAIWLDDFIDGRLSLFGDYEDAISAQRPVLFHSVLTPLLNIGLLSPRQVVDAALARVDRVPLNSLEGFVRQVIGWREFVRLVYLTRGRWQRTRNFWGFTHPMPAAFYTATTGVDPVDHVIAQALRSGYCHHIERLMILGNFMLLCEIAPDAVYRWFMELFVDAYDWVMVPNVYGMSQHADGGGMTTKPYLSGSSYILKMSDFRRGPWTAIWDALYWHFIDSHAAFFAANPRTTVIVKARDRLGPKLAEHRRLAEDFLVRIHGG